MTSKPESPGNMSLTGQILIAMPQMGDPRFSQSVIFLCAHTKDGAMGIIVNRPLNKPDFGDLLKQLEIEPHPPARRRGNHRSGRGEPTGGLSCTPPIGPPKAAWKWTASTC